jgi:hypothetical protein
MQGYGGVPMQHQRGSTVGEGFSFGCGFILASFLAAIGMAVGIFLLILIFGQAVILSTLP